MNKYFYLFLLFQIALFQNENAQKTEQDNKEGKSDTENKQGNEELQEPLVED